MRIYVITRNVCCLKSGCGSGYEQSRALAAFPENRVKAASMKTGGKMFAPEFVYFIFFRYFQRDSGIISDVHHLDKFNHHCFFFIAYVKLFQSFAYFLECGPGIHAR